MTTNEIKEIAERHERRLPIGSVYNLSEVIEQAILEATKDLSTTTEAQRKEIEVLDSRMKYLARHIWDTRYMSDMPSNEEDYDRLIGIAAEINSGNFTAIDSAISKQK